MRFESKNAQLKGFVSRNSYKNVPLTASIHHQQWMCYHLLARPDQVTTNFFYAGDDIISGTAAKFNVFITYVGQCMYIYCIYRLTNNH